MNLPEFLSHPGIKLPVERTTDDFETFIESRLFGFSELRSSLDAPDDVLSIAYQNEKIDLIHPILSAINLTFLGQPQRGYEILASALNRLKNMKPTYDALFRRNLSSADLGFLYRVRKHAGPTLRHDGIFHVPFEERHKVATQRFSTPGLPCLYLGGSVHTCWAEMAMPPFHELSASAFWLKQGETVTILDLSCRANRLARDCRVEEDAIVNTQDYLDVLDFLLLWPLYFAISIHVKHPEGAFKPEYIIPQLLLQWISNESDVDGVCYPSTHISALPHGASDWKICNFVFPARTAPATGHCSRLKELFSHTTPYNWQLLNATMLGMSTRPQKLRSSTDYGLAMIGECEELYDRTEFGQLQGRLDRLAEIAIFPDEVDFVGKATGSRAKEQS